MCLKSAAPLHHVKGLDLLASTAQSRRGDIRVSDYLLTSRSVLDGIREPNSLMRLFGGLAFPCRGAIGAGRPWGNASGMLRAPT